MIKNNSRTQQIIASVMDLAKANANNGEMASSAQTCYADARSIMASKWGNSSPAADLSIVAERALKSLAYSVGASHPDYEKACRMVQSVSSTMVWSS